MTAVPLDPGAVIGILGGGQLGRMLSMAAARLGFRCHIYDPDLAAPAAQVAQSATHAGWEDAAALESFSAACDVVTYEFENIPLVTLDALRAPVHPGRRALEVSQDRLTEKHFLADLGLRVAPFEQVDDAAGLTQATAKLGDGILKTRRFGYDGKGQVRLPCPDPLDAIGNAPAIVEALVPFEREISVIVARAQDGQTVSYDPGENLHENGILRRTTIPASVAASVAAEAREAATRIAAALDYVGVLGVELFVAPEGIVVNEIAPRVHNSGHWTMNGCAVDQFEQHIRAIAGWPLGDGARHADVTMENLIGEEVAGVLRLAAAPGHALHLYGKAQVRSGRKMGHINRVSPLAR
ncbi:5-(carboxyamino)imidazole ribonucleotide synthase [Roseitranquillus sediminis]|uniref:5-(carboxyamino)imidazole ribonucleotide synthase n=1 Tax=Roseitranquillus sediminis TaxID=2809051 RepID=UPI001D0CCABC|nr:5-(carboxyamino)imidazole ribonucleotide synthase [Roseitranquillus sediminis]MBM9594436.1 5-(carboxyamino)imidazole ribonucleotide synthase [Roseitranquillus sediminis]